jgi:asparagine synthase (glutamine-hydrolysing)
MCRIVGFHDFTLVDNDIRDRVTQLKNIMKRGGPDDDGEFIDYENKIALGHRRLSIIDLSSAGHQPMLNNEQDLVLVFNGEIYNYIELKKDLIKFGYNFFTTSDTEVVLNAYKKWGNECFKYFNGMFAIVIYNKITQEFIFARDHAGIKPLYIFNDTNKIYFSSELRALKLLPFTKSNKDWETYFLLFGYMPEPLSTLENVSMFPKSNYAVYNIKNKKINYFEYFSFKHTSLILDKKIAQNEIKEKLIKSVTRHLISDAPIALFLSGGIDSSLLTLLSSPILNEKLTTLSISFDEKLYSERKYQQLIIDKTNSQHINFNITKNIFIENLFEFFHAIDQPTIDGINTFFISKLAKDNGFKVALSGLGADELFGGYPSNDRVKFIELARFIPKFLLKYFIH